MKVGVTGAGGQLGRLVVQKLLERGRPEDIVAIVRDRMKVADLAKAGVEIWVAAYDDRQALDAAVAGLDKLLLISSSTIASGGTPLSRATCAQRAASDTGWPDTVLPAHSR